MATLLHSESRRLYSWWWDSHISPKNSKWLQDNLTDMDNKVKAMIKLIEEDADSFARRAEMFYKKRPELMKLVEEFYRAYRALAERYDYATVELRQAHRTMAEAFPNQVPYALADDSLSGSSGPEAEPHTPEMPHPIRALFDPEDLQKDALGLFLTNLNSIRNGGYSEESECGAIKRGLKPLNEMFGSGVVPEKIAVGRMDKGLNIQEAESERTLQNLFSQLSIENRKKELSRVQTEKESSLLQYRRCLEIMSTLENKITLAEENSQMHNEQTERAETEIKALKQELSKLKEEKEIAGLRYEQCLETIVKLESEISHAQEDSKRLSGEIQVGAAKLKSVEEHCVLLETSNQSLQSEADSLAQKIAIKDQELLEKQNELEKLQILLQDEHSQFAQVESTLRTLQKLHSQSQEEQRALTLELQNRLQMLKDLETCNHDLEDGIQQVKKENLTLNELNNSSTISLKSMQNKISSLKEMKEKLEEDVALQVGQNNGLQEEIYHLKEEIKGLNSRYQALMEQVQSVGLNPECLESSVKELQDQNSKLIKVCNNHRDEKDALYEKLRDMDNNLQKKTLLESSLSVSNAKLEGSTEKVKELQESCQFLQGEKSALLSEKAALLSQLQVMTENMQKLLEKNTLLDNSLSAANIELEGLRAKSRIVEELCQFLKNEKSDLLKERNTLVSQLESVEERLGNLESRFTRLEGKYADLETEKESTLVQVEQLRGSLGVEKQEHASYVQSSESRWADLEKHVYVLREDCRSTKRDFEEELDKAVNAHVEIFILQKFIEDLEQKNLSLLVECQKHVEASKLSDKLISELEIENLEQQVEEEFLLDEIENLRVGIYQVFRALQFDAVCKHEDKIEQEQIPILRILGDIDDLKCSLSRNEDEKHQLVVENSVLLSLLEQLRLDGAELESEKKILENDFEIITEQHGMLQKDKHELLEMNLRLKLEVSKGELQEKVLKDELETQHVKLGRLQGAYLVLQEENSKALEENRLLLKKNSELKEEMCILEDENGVILQEAVALSNISLVFQSFGTEKAKEVKALAEDLNNLELIKSDLKQKVETLGEKLDIKEAENQDFNEKVDKLHKELEELNGLNGQLNYQILIGQDFLRQKAIELLEAEEKLKATHNMNAEMCRTVEELKRECKESKLIRESVEKQILELSEFCRKQKEEIEHLHEVNKNLESEGCMLHKEIEKRRVREEYLSLKLQEKSNEFELWDVEAASFYFDLQISAIREVLLKNKVHELTGVCENLEDESATKSVEIEQMKERVGSLESEIGELKAELSAYVPAIASLRDNIESLAQGALSQTNLPAAAYPEEVDDELDDQHHEMGCQELKEDRPVAATDGISYLREMEARIKTIETAVVGDRNWLAMQKSLNTSTDVEDLVKEPYELELRSTSHQEKDIQKEEIELEDELSDKLRQQKTKPEKSEVKNGLLMKDILLDQVSDCSFYGRSRGENGEPGDHMLELWESAEQDRSIDFIVSDTQKQANRPVESGIACHQLNDAEHKSQGPSSELQVEKELGVDKLEVSTGIKDPNQGRNKEKILKRLASDAQQLTGLQTSVQDLKKKVENNKRRKKANDLEYERVKQQLQEVEEAIMQLVDTNDQLEKDIEESLSSLDGKNSTEMGETGDTYRKRAIEHARKGSEKIGRLQFEVQSIEYVLLKLEDERKNKAKSRFSDSRTGVLLRDFISSGGRKSRRRKKSCFCGCMRSSTNEE